MSRIEREQHDKNYNREREKMGIHTRLLVRSINGYRTYYVWTHVYVTPKTVIKRIANACEWWDGTTGKQGACNEDGCRFALRVTINTCGAHTLGLLKRECFFVVSSSFLRFYLIRMQNWCVRNDIMSGLWMMPSVELIVQFGLNFLKRRDEQTWPGFETIETLSQVMYT